MLYGYANNLIYIDLSTENVEKRKIKEDISYGYRTGGREFS